VGPQGGSRREVARLL